MSRPLAITLLAFVAFTSLGMPDGLLGVSWPSIRGDMDRPLDALGLLVVVQTAGYLTSSFLTGRILQVLPIGTLLALSTAAAATALLGFAATPFWWLMLGLGFLAGLGGGAVDAGLNAYGATHFSARTLNWLHAFFGLGTTIGPLIVTSVLGAGLDWRWSYLLVGSAQACWRRCSGGAGRGGSGCRRTPPAADAPRVRAARARDTLRLPPVWLGMLTYFFYTGMEVTTAQWTYSLLTIGRGVPATTAGLMVSLYWGSMMVGRVLFGIVADRVPMVATLRGCIVASLRGRCCCGWSRRGSWRSPA
ncbi:MAG: MFS transporter [Geminicoccaceae bacterium]